MDHDDEPIDRQGADDTGRDAVYAALFGRLPRVPTPDALAALVESELAGRPIERMLASLERRRAPDVLARLVAEDVGSGPAAVARRHLHGLPRLSAPASAGTVRAPGRSWGERQRALGLLAAAAIALVALIPFAGRVPERGRAGSDPERERSAPRFRLVIVNSAEALDPLARGFAEGLTGGRPLRSDG